MINYEKTERRENPGLLEAGIKQNGRKKKALLHFICEENDIMECIT